MLSSRELLESLLSNYQKKLLITDCISVKFLILPEKETYFLNVEPGVPLEISEDSSKEPQVTFIGNLEILKMIESGEMTGLTAIARENMQDKAPLDIKFSKSVSMNSDLMNQVYQFIQKFFNPTYPEKMILDKSHTRVIHGAHALPLYYHTGFRSAWYFLEKGQRLNKPGDTNPFSQAFVIISGEGLAKIGDETFPVKGNETYMIPPLTEHMLWADNEPITLIYLAWGEGA